MTFIIFWYCIWQHLLLKVICSYTTPAKFLNKKAQGYKISSSSSLSISLARFNLFFTCKSATLSHSDLISPYAQVQFSSGRPAVLSEILSCACSPQHGKGSNNFNWKAFQLKDLPIHPSLPSGHRYRTVQTRSIKSDNEIEGREVKFGNCGAHASNMKMGNVWNLCSGVI